MWGLKKPCNCPEEAHDIFVQVAESIKKSLVIRQKGKSQNGGNKKTKHAKVLKKEHFLLHDTRMCAFLTPWYAYVRISYPMIRVCAHFLPHDTPLCAFLTPWYAYVWLLGGKQYSFFGKFSVFCFLVNSVLRFALVPYYQRNRIINRFLANVPVL